MTKTANAKTDNDWVLKEIIHKPVTFSAESLQRDTDSLNEAIQKGYKINDIVKTETGIVYVLIKWEKNTALVKSRDQLEKQNNSWSIVTGGKS